MAALVVIVGLQWMFQINADGTGYLAQRSMAAGPTPMPTAGVVFAWVQVLARSLVWVVIAVALVVLYPLGAGEVDVARGSGSSSSARRAPGPGRAGCSSRRCWRRWPRPSTRTSTGASYWSHDLYGRLWCRACTVASPTAADHHRRAPPTLLLVALSLVVMAHLGSIQQAWQTSLLVGAGLGSGLVLRRVWERANAASELAGIASSALLAPLLLASPLEEWTRLAVMALVSTLATALAAWWLPQTESATLDAFYRRVRPAGWWPASATRAGEPASAPLRRLGGALASAGLCAASLFLGLVGSGAHRSGAGSGDVGEPGAGGRRRPVPLW